MKCFHAAIKEVFVKEIKHLEIKKFGASPSCFPSMERVGYVPAACFLVKSTNEKVPPGLVQGVMLLFN